jgi:hypothetical protein
MAEPIGRWKSSASRAVKIAAATTPRVIALRQVGGASARAAGRLRPARARALASSRLRGRAARRLLSMRPPWVPRCLRRRFFLVWAISAI